MSEATIFAEKKPQGNPNWRKGVSACPTGRPKGLQNKITVRQREVAAMVLGTPGTPEFDEFVSSERRAALAQTMAPQIKALWMHYLLGIPKVSVEVKQVSENFDDVPLDELRSQSLELAARIAQSLPLADADAQHPDRDVM